MPALRPCAGFCKHDLPSKTKMLLKIVPARTLPAMALAISCVTSYGLCRRAPCGGMADAGKGCDHRAAGAAVQRGGGVLAPR